MIQHAELSWMNDKVLTSQYTGSRENRSLTTSYSMKQRVLKIGRMFESIATDGAWTNIAPPSVFAAFRQKCISEPLSK